jgi:hypothetical protein
VPTYERDQEFVREWKALTLAQRRLFKRAVRKFVEDLKAKRTPRASLGIRGFQGREGVFEFHWADNGRALFSYGTSPHPDEVHIIWLSIGTHDIYYKR